MIGMRNAVREDAAVMAAAGAKRASSDGHKRAANVPGWPA